MQLQYLREFRVLGMRMSFSAAAEELYITQPALSNHIKAVEEELGVLLVDRGKGRQPRLTKAGALLLNRVDKLIALIDDIEEECAQLKESQECRLNVRLPLYINASTEPMINLVKAFSKERPEIDIIFIPGNSSREPLEELLQEVTDCHLLSIPEGIDPTTVTESCRMIPLGVRNEILVLFRTDNPLFEKSEIQLQDLLEYCFITRNRAISKLGEFWFKAFFGDHAKQPLHTVRFSESFENFVFNEFEINDVQFFPAHYRDHPMLAMSTGMVMRSLTPPVYAHSYIVFRANDQNPASTGFKQYLLEQMEGIK
jgi:DNA-binding transcriptional LysR family regulator